MATSTEKIAQLVAEYQKPPPPDAGGAEMAVRTLLGMGIVGPHMLPTDPSELDGLLDYLAAQCLLRRSDDAQDPDLVLEILYGGDEDAGLPELPDAEVVE